MQNDGLHGWRSRTTARSAAGSPEMQSRGQTWQALLKAPRRAPTPTSPTHRTTGEHPPSRNPHHRARSQHTHNLTHTPLLHLPNVACAVARFKTIELQLGWQLVPGKACAGTTLHTLPASFERACSSSLSLHPPPTQPQFHPPLSHFPAISGKFPVLR